MLKALSFGVIGLDQGLIIPIAGVFAPTAFCVVAAVCNGEMRRVSGLFSSYATPCMDEGGSVHSLTRTHIRMQRTLLYVCVYP